MNKKLVAVLAGMAVVITLANGCGSGSGTGRYSVPSDIINGGGGGTSGGGGGTTETNVESLILSAWEDFKYGAYSSAIAKFNDAISNANIKAEQKPEAYNGLGWSYLKSQGASSAKAAFETASTQNDEARIGLAASLMNDGKDGCRRAAELLENMGLKETSTVFTAKHPIGVSNAGAHAMLAWCYFIIGNDDGARNQIKFAISADGTSDSAVAQIYNSMLAMGLTID